MEINIDIGEKIKALRKESKLTQDELCNNLNKKYNTSINKGMISKWENGREQPRLQFIINLADYFNTEVSYLLGISEKRYAFSTDEIRKITNGYIQEIIFYLNFICHYFQANEFFTNIVIKLADIISEIDFYDSFDIFESDIYKNIESYCNLPIGKDIIEKINYDLKNTGITDEVKVMLNEIFDEDDPYDFKTYSLELIKNEDIVKEVIESIRQCPLINDIAIEIAKLIEKYYFSVIIRDVLFELVSKLNQIGIEKTLDYIIDLNSNGKYKEGE